MEHGPDTTHVEWLSRPSLRSPTLVIAFEGWNDAGDAATLAVSHLRDRRSSVEIARIDPEPFYDFTVTRPTVELVGEHDRTIRWPSNAFWSVETDADEDLVVFLGVEPQMMWRTFSRQFMGVTAELGVRQVVTLGALLADVPHQRPVPVYASSDDEALMASLALEASTYEGPTGIVGVLGSILKDAAIPSASFWAAVPAYVPGATSPKATLALIERLHDLLGMGGPTTDLELASAAYEREVDQMVADDDETAAYVQQLIEHHDMTTRLEPAAADELVEEVEQFLRDQPD